MTPDQWQAEAAMVVIALAGTEEPRAFYVGGHTTPYCVLCEREACTTAGPIHHAADCPWRVARELADDPDYGGRPHPPPHPRT